MSSAGAGLWSVDLGTGRIWATERTFELFGFGTGEELTVEKVLGSVHPEDHERIGQAVQQTLQSGQETVADCRVVLPGGNVCWIASRGRTHANSAGAPNRVLGVSVDITDRKRAEMALRESEERFRQVAENVGDFIWEVDANGLYRYTSPSVEKILGYRADDLIGKKHFYDLFAPEIREELKSAAFKVFATKQPFRAFPNPNVSKSGKVVHLETSGAPVLDAAGSLVGYRGADTDVTERQEMENKIKKAAEEWQTTFDSSQDLIFILDKDFKIVRVNAATLSFFKLPIERILGNPCYSLMHGTGEPPEICPFRAVMETKRHEETEFYDPKRDAWFQVSVDPILDGNGEIEGVVHRVQEITKRKQAEVEIAASALRYRTVADYTYDWEYWSAPDGTLNYVSPSCERITGYSVQEFIDNPSLLTGIIVLEDNIAWNKHDHDARTELRMREVQFRIRTRSGEVRWIDHTCVPVSDAQGKPLGIRASNRDITDRKKAEIEAQQHRDELARVNRLGTIGELTSSLAHELNQPLTAIRNYANAALRFLSRGEPDLSKAREALDGIVQNDRRAAEVIQRVRALLRREEPRYDLLYINDVIRDILTFLQSDSILEGLSIEIELAPGLPAVLGDRVQLQQVLVNLILNAVAAMHEIRPDLRKVVIRTEKQEDQGVKVSVRDSGVGIDQAHKDRMFEPFYTTKPEGMGMGLPISLGIIHAHGGSMGAENNPDRGATFYFTLPIKDK